MLPRLTNPLSRSRLASTALAHPIRRTPAIHALRALTSLQPLPSLLLSSFPASRSLPAPPAPPEQIKFAQYLLARFKQVGVTKIFGIPGDFSLHACDEVERDGELGWVGNSSELTAVSFLGWERFPRGREREREQERESTETGDRDRIKD